MTQLGALRWHGCMAGVRSQGASKKENTHRHDQLTDWILMPKQRFDWQLILDGSKIFCSHMHTFCKHHTYGVPFSLRRTRTQANLDTRTTFAGEGREQRCARRGQPSKVDFAPTSKLETGYPDTRLATGLSVTSKVLLYQH